MPFKAASSKVSVSIHCHEHDKGNRGHYLFLAKIFSYFRALLARACQCQAEMDSNCVWSIAHTICIQEFACKFHK